MKGRKPTKALEWSSFKAEAPLRHLTDGGLFLHKRLQLGQVPKRAGLNLQKL